MSLLCTSLIYGADEKQCDALIQRGVDLMLHKNHVKSLEILFEAKELAKKNNWHQQLFLAQNNIGNNYYMLSDYGEALKQFLVAYDFADKHLGRRQKMIVLNNIAILYSKEKKYEKAKDFFEKAISIAEDERDSLKIGLYSLNLGNLANDQNKLNDARKFFSHALRYTKHKVVEIPAQVGLCNTELLAGHSKVAIAEGLRLLSLLHKENNEDNRIALQTIIAKSYLRENNLATALQWTNIAMASHPDLEGKIELYQLLATIYYRLNSYSLAFQYKDSIAIGGTKLTEIRNGKLFESNEAKLQLRQYKEKIEEREARIASDKKIFYAVITLIVFGFVIILLLFRNRIMKIKQKALLIEREQEIIAFKLEKEIAENALLVIKEQKAFLEQERLQREIELRNQKILSRTLYLNERNELLKGILSSLSSLPELIEVPQISKYVKELKAHMKADGDWDNYIRHFDEVNYGFIKKLTDRHPDLTTTDLRYISFVYMNLDTKEIANILNITPVACRKRKERIEKRLKLADGITLLQYLVSI